MILTFRPIKVWPPGWQERRFRGRSSSPFRASYSQTLDLLDREIHAVDGTNATLQVDASERDCKIDGQLRADARPASPGIILTVETRKRGTLVWSTDRFAHWQENLRAIALGMEALRRVERYGIADQGQQYAGYRELGAGMPMPAAQMSVEEAARLLAEFGSGSDDVAAMVAGDHNLVDYLYRLGAKAHHPDHGGDPALFKRLTEARDLLRVAP